MQYYSLMPLLLLSSGVIFWEQTYVGPRNHVLDRVLAEWSAHCSDTVICQTRKTAFDRGMRTVWPCYRPCEPLIFSPRRAVVPLHAKISPDVTLIQKLQWKQVDRRTRLNLLLSSLIHPLITSVVMLSNAEKVFFLFLPVTEIFYAIIDGFVVHPGASAPYKRWSKCTMKKIGGKVFAGT